MSDSSTPAIFPLQNITANQGCSTRIYPSHANNTQTAAPNPSTSGSQLQARSLERSITKEQLERQEIFKEAAGSDLEEMMCRCDKQDATIRDLEKHIRCIKWLKDKLPSTATTSPAAAIPQSDDLRSTATKTSQSVLTLQSHKHRPIAPTTSPAKAVVMHMIKPRTTIQRRSQTSDPHSTKPSAAHAGWLHGSLLLTHITLKFLLEKHSHEPFPPVDYSKDPRDYHSFVDGTMLKEAIGKIRTLHAELEKEQRRRMALETTCRCLEEASWRRLEEIGAVPGPWGGGVGGG
ncbi:hypothetical protein IWX49DRAFT_553280 [Phyllosticta citricarpa]